MEFAGWVETDSGFWAGIKEMDWGMLEEWMIIGGSGGVWVMDSR